MTGVRYPCVTRSSPNSGELAETGGIPPFLDVRARDHKSHGPEIGPGSDNDKAMVLSLPERICPGHNAATTCLVTPFTLPASPQRASIARHSIAERHVAPLATQHQPATPPPPTATTGVA